MHCRAVRNRRFTVMAALFRIGSRSASTTVSRKTLSPQCSCTSAADIRDELAAAAEIAVVLLARNAGADACARLHLIQCLRHVSRRCPMLSEGIAYPASPATVRLVGSPCVLETHRYAIIAKHELVLIMAF